MMKRKGSFFFLFFVLVFAFAGMLVGSVSAFDGTMTLDSTAGGFAWFTYMNSAERLNEGAYDFWVGETFVFNCQAYNGYSFSHWEITSGGTTQTSVEVPLVCQTFVAVSFSVTAVFVANDVTYSITVAKVGSGQVYMMSGGYSVGEGIYQRAFNTTATFSANPVLGYAFSGFSLSNGTVGVASPFSMNITGNMVVTAQFVYTGGSSGGSGNDNIVGGNGTGIVDFTSNSLSVAFANLPMLLKMIVIFLVVLGVPMCLVVLVPQVGMAGFFGTMAFSTAVATFVLGLPLWILVITGMGLALMLFSMMNRGTNFG